MHTHTCTHAHLHKDTHSYKYSVARLWIRFHLTAKDLCSCRASGIWFRFSWWRSHGLGGGVRWRSPSWPFTITAGCFSSSVYTTQKPPSQKKVFWLGVNHFPLIISPKKQIRTCSFNNKLVSAKKKWSLCVLACNHLEFMESFQIVSKPQSKMLTRICFFRYRYLYFLVYTTRTCVYFHSIPFLPVKIHTTWMKWMSENIAGLLD